MVHPEVVQVHSVVASMEILMCRLWLEARAEVRSGPVVTPQARGFKFWTWSGGLGRGL